MSNLLSTVGENPDFIAFNAHLGAAFIAVSFGVPIWLVLLLAAIKEFWLDIKYETNPPQTYLDGLLDFSGYLAGALLTFLPHS